MINLEQLTKIALNEAPLSSYAKALGSKLISPAAYARGAGKVLQGASKATGGLTTSTKTLAGALGNVGSAATKLGTTNTTPKSNNNNSSPKNTVQTQRQLQTQDLPEDLSRTKTEFIINNRQLQARYVGETKTGYPIYNVQGIPWAKSIVLEPKGKGKYNIYMYPDKKPNVSKQPSAVRPGSINFSGVQNKLIVTTK